MQVKSVVDANLVQKSGCQTDFQKIVLGFGETIRTGLILQLTMRVALPFLLLFLSLTACDSPAEQNLSPVYFDVAGFIDSQVKELSARKPTVEKTLLVGDKKSRQATADVNWRRELELFSQADINKPALRGSYRIDRPDSLTYNYTLRPTEERLTVRSLRVQMDRATGQPRRIEAVLVTDNPLYTSEQHLLFEKKPGSQSIHYNLTGFQKLAYIDKRDFMVDGEIK